jgi:hypothetical protein
LLRWKVSEERFKVKKFKILAVTTSLCFLICTNAYADDQESLDSGLYLQGGIASLNYEYGSYQYELGTTYAIYAGYNINKYLAIEVLYATASTPNYSTTVDFSGGFLKPKLPIGESLELFGRFGRNNLSVTSSYAGTNQQSYTSYGGGLTAYMDAEKKNFISAEYMIWASEGIEKLWGTSISYGKRF